VKNFIHDPILREGGTDNPAQTIYDKIGLGANPEKMEELVRRPQKKVS